MVLMMTMITTNEVWGCTAPGTLKITTPKPHMTMAHVGGMITMVAVADHHNIVIGGGMIPLTPTMQNPSTLYVRGSFSSPQCPHEMEGDFSSSALMKNGEHYATEDDFFAIKFLRKLRFRTIDFGGLEAGDLHTQVSILIQL